MPHPASFSAEAWNPVPDSDNRIHADDVALQYGFRGGLVPGVVVSAYLLHPAAVAWGQTWVDRGRAHVVVRSPVYDGEAFRVEVSEADDDRYTARLIDPRDVVCATAEASLPETLPRAPARRGDPLLARDHPRPRASRRVMEGLREEGLKALFARWNRQAEISHYFKNEAALAPIFRASGQANPGFILGMTNWVLGQNVAMSPWLHLETESQHFRGIPSDSDLIVEAQIADLFEKKGHEFVDVDVAAYDARDDAAVASVRLRAIYRLRAPSGEEGRA